MDGNGGVVSCCRLLEMQIDDLTKDEIKPAPLGADWLQGLLNVPHFPTITNIIKMFNL